VKIVKTFGKFCWIVIKQKNRIIMEKIRYSITLSVPKHRELKRGTLRNLIKDAGLLVE